MSIQSNYPGWPHATLAMRPSLTLKTLDTVTMELNDNIITI